MSELEIVERKDERRQQLTHVVGCYVIDASASFLNGGGKGESKQGYDNYTVVKMMRDGRAPGGVTYYVAYVSGQAVRYWVRTTMIKMTGWPPSLKRALGLNPNGNPEKSGTARDPINFPEDDLFGYMDTMSKELKAILKLNEKIESGEFKLPQNGNVTSKQIAEVIGTKLDTEPATTTITPTDEDKDQSDSEADAEAATAEKEAKAKDKAKNDTDSDTIRGFFRTSPVSMSPIVSLRNSAWEGVDNAYVYTPDGSIPFQTQFINSAMSGFFTLDYSSVGVFHEIGDKNDLDPEMRDINLANGKLIEDLENRPEFYSAEVNTTIQEIADHLEAEKAKKRRGSGKDKTKEAKKYYIPIKKFGRTFKLANLEQIRYERSTAFLRAISKLEGGARQAVFCTDVSPKCIALAGTSNGIPILNSIFEDYTLEGPRGKNVKLKTAMLKDIIIDHADDIVTPVVIGVLSDYLENDLEVKQLNKTKVKEVEIIVTTPVQAVELMCSLLPGADKYGTRKFTTTTSTTTTSAEIRTAASAAAARLDESDNNDNDNNNNTDKAE